QQAPLSDELKRLEVGIALRNHQGSSAVQRALELVNPDSNDYKDALWLGQVLKESGQRPEQAERHLRRAVELGPSVPETWIALVDFLAFQHRLDQAEAEIVKAQSKLPRESADLPLGQCYEAVGKPDAARKHYMAAMTARPHDAVILRAFAGFCISDGKLSEAEGHLRRISDKQVTATKEDADWARRNLAWVRAAIGGREGLTEALALVGMRVDDSGNPLDFEGALPADQYRQQLQAQARVLAVHNRRKFRQLAIAKLEKLNKIETLSADDLYLLAQLHEADGNWTRAKQDFRD